MPFLLPQFSFTDDDPLAAEHRAVAEWVEEAAVSLSDHWSRRDNDLKALASGQKLISGDLEQCRRYLLAAVDQVRFWDTQLERLKPHAPAEQNWRSLPDPPGWNSTCNRRKQACNVIKALLRRTLPLQRTDVLALLAWCNSLYPLTQDLAPVGSIIQGMERYAARNPLDEELRSMLREFAYRLGQAPEVDVKRLRISVEQLCEDELSPMREETIPVRPAPQPAAAGDPRILVEFKQFLGLIPYEPERVTTTISSDEFPLAEDSPLREEHQLLSKLMGEIPGITYYSPLNLRSSRFGTQILELTPLERGLVLLAAFERQCHAILRPRDIPTDWTILTSAMQIAASLGEQPFEINAPQIFDLILYLSAQPGRRLISNERLAELLCQIHREAETTPLTEGERYALWRLRASLIPGALLGAIPDDVELLTELIGDGARFCLAAGEAWTDCVNNEFSRMTTEERTRWSALFSHALSATAARPSAKWLKTGEKLVAGIGGDVVQESLLRWLPLVTEGRSIQTLGSYVGDVRGQADTMLADNATCLRGLLWLVQMVPRPDELLRELTAVALSAYKKVPGVGPRAVKVGNAAVYALSEMGTLEAVGQLALLKVRVKTGSAQKEIEKAFNTAAEALGLPRDQIEEMGVPSYGLDENGRLRESFGDYQAELAVSGSDARLQWTDAKGKPLKSVPAKVKQDHKEELKELQQSLKDVQGMLPAQRDRIDSLFLSQRTWSVDAWRERYLNHPLVGTIARRLLWCVDGTPACWASGNPEDLRGEPIPHGKTAEISLWHPVGRPVEEVTGWRRRLEELQISQPFKQAYREVYLLTDAERRTETYSNRYAAHIIRQHQFNALCAARGWKNKLRLMVDAEYEPPFKLLPQWGLRAEFWVEGLGNDYGGDTNESGVFLRLATDQVRFYQLDAAANSAHAGGGGYTNRALGPGARNVNTPLPLEEIPALVFSEIMRDVDLFVGVASVGNDPAWQDGGPEGRYREYWQSYSFGELAGSASTRKQVLERLVPRLKIAERCSFSDRFLIVRGSLRTYKIHLGSGNILMEPNDQYLCIVPDSKARSQPAGLYLPFEGDNTLSIILSKALLLADDSKIKDPSITRQIKGI